MNWDTVNHPLWPYRDRPRILKRDPDECPKCGSIQTFKAWGTVLVCKECWTKSPLV